MAIISNILAAIIVAFMCGGVNAATAQNVIESSQLQHCLKRADELPDQAAAEATVWIKNKGGSDAHLCHAFADANRGKNREAAQEFFALASVFDKTDPQRALTMHDLAAQQFLRARDTKNGVAQYSAALKIKPDDISALLGRAEARMTDETYWDALPDLNHALHLQPDNLQALRQRVRAWTMLGNDENAKDDLDRIEALQPTK